MFLLPVYFLTLLVSDLAKTMPLHFLGPGVVTVEPIPSQTPEKEMSLLSQPPSRSGTGTGSQGWPADSPHMQEYYQTADSCFVHISVVF